MNDCKALIESYEQTARDLANVAYDYFEKSKNATSHGKRVEYRDKADMYKRLSKEKYNEARILKERIK